MKFTQKTPGSVRAMTLMEMLIAVAIASLVFAAVAALSVYTTRSFVAMGNYADLDQYSRGALDTMSREIRQTRSLVSFQTNRLVFEDNDGATNLVYHWDPVSGLLTRQKGNQVSVLLTNCDFLTFGVSQRNPSNSFAFHPATNSITGQFDVSQAKLVDVSWRCSRQILGQKVNTESVQTAKIVMRN